MAEARSAPAAAALHRAGARAGLALAALSLAAPARAEEARPHRRWGLGTAQGPNVASATLWTDRGRVGAGSSEALIGLTLPTLELTLFLPQLSLDTVTSFTGTVVAAGFQQVFYVTDDVYTTFHFGHGVARFLVGPGVGFSAALREDARGVQNGASLRMVSQFGLELLTRDESFGFRVLGRPWIELGSVNGLEGSERFASGGLAQHFAFFGYFRR